ncbi:MAG: replication-associated recombination protein A [Desulfobacteraceae bacterium]|nr:replication-associated recombination protein A [Desulfobacteraceae bacterium]MBC2754073.1 replication-associated recombination protein A [Desulfobacteraceae bacterium]
MTGDKNTLDLFEHQAQKATAGSRPLADRMRPVRLDQFIGQEQAVGNGSLIRNAIENDRIFSMILWGPPGCGKTTLARIIAEQTRCHFSHFSAVLSGVKDIRNVIEAARQQRNFHQNRTIVFVDEIHRFNKAQQDAFLHHVESGLITLVGATTENPSFEVIPALLSRCQVITLSSMSESDMKVLLNRALSDNTNGLGRLELTYSDSALDHIIGISDGDARAALNALEISAVYAASKTIRNDNAKYKVPLKAVENALQRKALIYDKSGEAHFNLISAFHKSLRGSDPDAAIYWLGRMLSSGEDPMYIARRMVRFASEDVGNADPSALSVAMAAMEAFRFLGSPEGDLCLAQAAVYLATAPKSNSIYTAYEQTLKTIKQTGALPVPMHIRNAPTRLMKDLGYGKDYKYAHDYKDAFVPQNHLPEKLQNEIFYTPTTRGYEKIVKERLDKWRALKKQHQKTDLSF